MPPPRWRGALPPFGERVRTNSEIARRQYPRHYHEGGISMNNLILRRLMIVLIIVVGAFAIARVQAARGPGTDVIVVAGMATIGLLCCFWHDIWMKQRDI